MACSLLPVACCLLPVEALLHATGHKLHATVFPQATGYKLQLLQADFSPQVPACLSSACYKLHATVFPQATSHRLRCFHKQRATGHKLTLATIYKPHATGCVSQRHPDIRSLIS